MPPPAGGDDAREEEEEEQGPHAGPSGHEKAVVALSEVEDGGGVQLWIRKGTYAVIAPAGFHAREDESRYCKPCCRQWRETKALAPWQ